MMLEAYVLSLYFKDSVEVDIWGKTSCLSSVEFRDVCPIQNVTKLYSFYWFQQELVPFYDLVLLFDCEVITERDCPTHIYDLYRQS